MKAVVVALGKVGLPLAAQLASARHLSNSRPASPSNARRSAQVWSVPQGSMENLPAASLWR